MNIAAIVLDIIILAVVAFFIVLSAKRGFAKTLIGFLGTFAALVLSVVGSWAVTDLVYGNFIKPSIESKLESAFTESAEKLGTTALIIDSAVNVLPDYIVNMAESENRFSDLEKEDNSDKLMSSASSAAEIITETVVKPCVTGIIQSVSMIVLFIIGIIAVKLISNAMSSLFSGKLLGGLNSFLGGVIGLPEGVLFAVILTWVIGYAVGVTENGIFGLNESVTDETYVFKIINSFNPIK